MTIRVSTARTVVVAAWAGLFVLLWAADEGGRYLGPRTQWVIPFGTVTLLLSLIGYLALTVRGRTDSRPVGRAEAAGSLALLLPILALLVIPAPRLGAQAASKKRPSNDVLISQLPSASERAKTTRHSSREASFVDVAVASLSPREGAPLGLAAGKPVRVQGLVIHDSGVPKTFGLARFFVSCCAADAMPIVVPVDIGARPSPTEDTWLVIDGTLTRRGTGLVVAAKTLQETDEPKEPYVSRSNPGAAASAVAAGPAVAIAGVPVAGNASVAATPPPPAAPAKPVLRTGKAAGFTGQAADVYDRYFAHCSHYTYDALAYPTRVPDAAAAAKLLAGPPREFQKPAYEGCLAGLNSDQATITVQKLLEIFLSQNGG